MNEDDTFRILTRLSLAQMEEIVLACGEFKAALDELMKNGWCLDEYTKALSERSANRVFIPEEPHPTFGPPTPKFRTYDGFGVETK